MGNLEGSSKTFQSLIALMIITLINLKLIIQFKVKPQSMTKNCHKIVKIKDHYDIKNAQQK